MAIRMRAALTCTNEYGVITIRIAICLLEIHIPEANSLKQKRSVLQSLIKRIRNQYNVSVSEVGSQDLWQRSEIGLAAVCHTGSGADAITRRLISFIEEDGRVNVISVKQEIY